MTCHYEFFHGKFVHSMQYFLHCQGSKLLGKGVTICMTMVWFKTSLGQIHFKHTYRHTHKKKIQILSKIDGNGNVLT